MTAARLEVQSFTTLDALPEAARALLQQAAQAHRSLQLGPEWLEVLQSEVFSSPPHTGQHLVAQRRRAGVEREPVSTPIAVLSLVGQRTPLGWQVQSLANYYSALAAPALHASLSDAELSALLRAVGRHFRPLRSLQLGPLEEAMAARLLPVLRASGYSAFKRVAHVNWQFTADAASAGESPWAAYLATRSANLRSTLARSQKRLQQAGGRVEILSAPADVARGLQAFEAVYARSWKTPESHPGFYRGLAHMAAERGWWRLGVAWLGEQPIAAQFWTVAHGRAEIHKLAYDEAHKALGAGTMLTAALMQHVLDVDRVHTVDYLTGDDAYKSRWMSTRTERIHLIAHPQHTVGGLLSMAQALPGRAWRWMGSTG